MSVFDVTWKSAFGTLRLEDPRALKFQMVIGHEGKGLEHGNWQDWI
ncbi:uncharacterized protein G2W53_009458 [Senna tora]|uniref:Uncharacterized protein n=1 Tax=Senna tora TaxID=362788 RepID=A0A835C880_9FABA|nr:uncharacterized protein G2W53_009458 [Senna tora]